MYLYIHFILVCEECADFFHGDCATHGALLPMADKSNLEGSEKSLATLPDGLEIKTSKIPNAGLGVFALNKLKSGSRFGPYQGKKVRPDIPRDEIDTSYMWEVWFAA